jgi:hypothetical protein
LNTTWVYIASFPQIFSNIRILNKILNLAYRHQPVIFKEGANSAFHEGMILIKLLIFIKTYQNNFYPQKKAIGDTIALSVLSWKHLKNINLLKSDKMTKGFLYFLYF